MLSEQAWTTSITDHEPRIRPYIRRTPILRVDASEFGLASFPLTFKLEQLQHSGSFKARGAFMNALLRPIPPAGIAAASGGNHGAAVAYAAMRLGVRCKIFVPVISSPAKIERIRSYGAQLVVGGERYADALAASDEYVQESRALSIHAFDSIETLYGTGTIGKELDEQCGGVETVLTAVGGGGLLAGVAAWYSGTDTRVIGVEPQLAPTLTNALAAGEPVDAPAEGIAADSLAPRQIGRVTFPILRDHVHAAMLVSEEEIQTAQRALWEVLRIVVEPGGATAFASLLSGTYRPTSHERVAVVISGANTAAVNFT